MLKRIFSQWIVLAGVLLSACQSTPPGSPPGSPTSGPAPTGAKARLTVVQASALDRISVETYDDAALCTGRRGVPPSHSGGEIAADKPITLGVNYSGANQLCRITLSFFSEASKQYRITLRIAGNQCSATLNDVSDATRLLPVFALQRTGLKRPGTPGDQWCDAVAQSELPQKGQRPAIAQNNGARTAQVTMADLRGLLPATLSAQGANPMPSLVAMPSNRPLEADKVFERAAPSIWQVVPFDGTQRLGLGSGVVIGPERVVTNCHVLAKANAVVLVKDTVRLVAKLEFPDPARDLCSLRVQGLFSAPVQLAPPESIRVGQKVFAIGNPLGLTLTLSDGLLSSLRRANDGRIELIQNSAPISSGSSGGGLFDDHGRLLGITTLAIVAREGSVAQNLNFAMPASFFTELEQRGRANLSQATLR